MDNLVFVHLSDIHFKRSSVGAHDVDRDLRTELVQDARQLTRELGKPSGVLVTGDIAFSGNESEYKHASAWLGTLCEAIDCEAQKVYVVPGNHDVDRKKASGPVVRLLHQAIRSANGHAIDERLREFFTDGPSAGAFLEPLTNFNAFAQAYGCEISADRPSWQRDHRLSCGTTVRLHGLCSAFVSNEHDAKGKMVLGTAYAAVRREPGVLNISLCHHPLEWLLDQDSVQNLIESRVHIQLFGHKHAQRFTRIEDMVRLVAGAMHPDRSESGWVPTYNVLTVYRHDHHRLALRLYQRSWHQSTTRFVAEHDPQTGDIFREFLWSGFPLPAAVVHPPRRTTPAQPVMASAPATPQSPPVLQPTTIPMAEDPRQRLTYRFFILDAVERFKIAVELGLIRIGDEALPGHTLFKEVFRRAVENQLLDQLWDQTERRYADQAHTNPFRTPPA